MTRTNYFKNLQIRILDLFRISNLELRIYRRLQAGYTLVEVLLYSIILGLFLLLTSQIFIAVKLTNAHALTFVSLSQNFRQIVSEITPVIRQANNVISPLPGEITTSLSLNDGAILYQVQDGYLKKTDSGQSWDLTTDEVTISDVAFENLVEATQTGAIKIKMTVESNYLLEGGKKLSEDLETTVSLR